MKGPFGVADYVKLSGLEMFWCIVFSTGLVALSGNFGLDLMAIRLGLLEVLCFLAIKKSSDNPVWSFPLKIYALYLIWLCVGLFYSPVPGYGIRVILKYIYCFVICLAASSIVWDEIAFYKSALWARKIALISLIFAVVPFIGLLIPGVFWYATALAIHYISIMILSLGLFFIGAGKKNLWYAIIFVIPCFLWVFRTSIMGSTLAIMVFFLFKYKLRALPIIAGFLVGAVVLVFAIPSVRDKMFYKSEGKTAEMVYEGGISSEGINSNGRFAMWGWSLEKFWEHKPLQGSGTGNLQETFYSLKHPFTTIRICHNDYVQILCDNGIVGIVLFGFAFLGIIVHCFKIYNTWYYPQSIKLAAITAGSSLAGMMLTMYTDNAINYSMATLSMPLGFYGMALGMVRKFENDNS